MRKAVRIGIGITFIAYVLVLIMLLYFGGRGRVFSELSMLEYIKRASNIVPFRTIHVYVLALFDGSLDISIPIKNLFGNMLLFVPMGLYLPYYRTRIDSFKRFTLTMTSILLFIEVTQLILKRGSFDIDDFILNMLGACVGYSAWKLKGVNTALRNITQSSN